MASVDFISIMLAKHIGQRIAAYLSPKAFSMLMGTCRAIHGYQTELCVPRIHFTYDVLFNTHECDILAPWIDRCAVEWMAGKYAMRGKPLYIYPITSDILTALPSHFLDRTLQADTTVYFQAGDDVSCLTLDHSDILRYAQCHVLPSVLSNSRILERCRYNPTATRVSHIVIAEFDLCATRLLLMGYDSQFRALCLECSLRPSFNVLDILCVLHKLCVRHQYSPHIVATIEGAADRIIAHAVDTFYDECGTPRHDPLEFLCACLRVSAGPDVVFWHSLGFTTSRLEFYMAALANVSDSGVRALGYMFPLATHPDIISRGNQTDILNFDIGVTYTAWQWAPMKYILHHSPSILGQNGPIVSSLSLGVLYYTLYMAHESERCGIIRNYMHEMYNISGRVSVKTTKSGIRFVSLSAVQMGFPHMALAMYSLDFASHDVPSVCIGNDTLCYPHPQFLKYYFGSDICKRDFMAHIRYFVLSMVGDTLHVQTIGDIIRAARDSHSRVFERGLRLNHVAELVYKLSFARSDMASEIVRDLFDVAKVAIPSPSEIPLDYVPTPYSACLQFDAMSVICSGRLFLSCIVKFGEPWIKQIVRYGLKSHQSAAHFAEIIANALHAIRSQSILVESPSLRDFFRQFVRSCAENPSVIHCCFGRVMTQIDSLCTYDRDFLVSLNIVS